MVKDKNFISLDHCPICGKEVGVAINQRMHEMPEHVISSPYLCNDCIKKLVDNNEFVMYESYPPKRFGKNGLAIDMPKITGRYIVMNMKFFETYPRNDDGFRFTERHRICFCDEKSFNSLLEVIKKCQTKN